VVGVVTVSGLPCLLSTPDLPTGIALRVDDRPPSGPVTVGSGDRRVR
jgi:hypothetical protein